MSLVHLLGDRNDPVLAGLWRDASYSIEWLLNTNRDGRGGLVRSCRDGCWFSMGDWTRSLSRWHSPLVWSMASADFDDESMGTIE